MRRVLALALLSALVPATAAAAPPQTGFEQREGADWTTHEEELAFLQAVDAGSARASVERIGSTKEGRPLHLVRVGETSPPTRSQGLRRPTILFVCSQHGNEPAGREACLKLLRDLAFTAPAAALRDRAFLFVPSANPDGRAANARENADGVDVNRDHLNLETAEARAVARLVRDWRPDVVLDLHEYGPSIPALYDDEVLYLWPRNLNVDGHVHDMAVDLARDYVVPGAAEAGYSSDEYGMYELAGNDVHQSAGDGDEGILRNTMGLRHALGVLIETAVTEDPRNGLQELTSPDAVMLRRVDSHMVVANAVLRFLRERGKAAASVTAGAAARKRLEGARRSAPVYFGGADNQEPAPEDVLDPPPCGYALTPEQLTQVGSTLGLLGVRTRGRTVSMAQAGEPLIPLLLDARGLRHAVEATPLTSC